MLKHLVVLTITIACGPLALAKNLYLPVAGVASGTLGQVVPALDLAAAVQRAIVQVKAGASAISVSSGAYRRGVIDAGSRLGFIAPAFDRKPLVHVRLGRR